MNIGGTNFFTDVFLLLVMALFIVPTVFAVNKVNQKGLCGGYFKDVYSRNILGLIGGILCLLPPGFIIGLPMVYIARAQMRYTYQRGYGFTTFALVVVYVFVIYSALMSIGSMSMGFGY